MHSQHKPARKLNVIGIKTPRERDIELELDGPHALEKYRIQLLDYVKATIREISNNQNNDTNVIVLQEYAFTPYPIPSAIKSVIIKELQEAINQSQQNIILVPGSFHHYKERKTADEKSKTKIASSQTYYQNLANVSDEEDDEDYVVNAYEEDLEHMESVLEEKYFYGLINSAYILSNNSKYIKRYKSEDRNERERFPAHSFYHKMKDNTINLLGDGMDAIQEMQFKDKTSLKVGVLVCLEHNVVPPSFNPAQEQIKKNPPDIEIIISDTLTPNEERYYADIKIHMDSTHGLVIEKSKAVGKFIVSEDTKTFEFDFKLPLDTNKKMPLTTKPSSGLAEQLFVAASSGDLASVKSLVAQGADIHYAFDQMKPITIAEKNRHMEIVDFLTPLYKTEKHRGKRKHAELKPASIFDKEKELPPSSKQTSDDDEEIKEPENKKRRKK